MAPTKIFHTSSTLSEAEVYFVARVAHDKLVEEASRKNQSLRRLVAHANLYDTLLDDYHSLYSDSEDEDSDADVDADADALDDMMEEPSQPQPPALIIRRAGKDAEIHIESKYVVYRYRYPYPYPYQYPYQYPPYQYPYQYPYSYPNPYPNPYPSQNPYQYPHPHHQGEPIDDFGAALIEEQEDLALCKVASRAENLRYRARAEGDVLETAVVEHD